MRSKEASVNVSINDAQNVNAYFIYNIVTSVLIEYPRKHSTHIVLNILVIEYLHPAVNVIEDYFKDIAYIHLCTIRSHKLLLTSRF